VGGIACGQDKRRYQDTNSNLSSASRLVREGVGASTFHLTPKSLPTVTLGAKTCASEGLKPAYIVWVGEVDRSSLFAISSR